MTVGHGLVGHSADPDERAVRVADGKFIGAPWFEVRCALFDDVVAHAGRHRVDILDIEIQANRIILNMQRPSFDPVKVQVPAAVVRENAVMAIIGIDAEAEQAIKMLAGIEIAAGKDRDDFMVAGHLSVP